MAKKYNCTKNGIQYFRKTKTIGHKMDGSPIKKEFYGDGEKDCDRQIEEYMNLVKDGLKFDKELITVEQLMHDWLFNVLLPSKDVKSSSFEKHECNYRLYIKKSEIAYLAAISISSKQIQNYYNKLYQKEEVSSKKIFDINKTLRKFFNYCITEHYSRENPCLLSKIHIPGDADIDDFEEDDEEEIIPFSIDEVNIITQNIQPLEDNDNTFSTAIQLDLITGLRRGELLGILKKDINLDKCTVKVRTSLRRVKNYIDEETYNTKLKLITPKTKKSSRTVPFPKNAKPILEKYFKEQELKYKNNCLKFDDSSLIFTTATCKPIDPSNFNKAWKRFLNRINLQYKKIHAIRDTYATTLVRRGAKILDVKELLGHSNIKTTEKYYLFVFPEDKIATANLINDFVS